MIVLLRCDLQQGHKHLPLLVTLVADIWEEVYGGRLQTELLSHFVHLAKCMATVLQLKFHLTKLVPYLTEFLNLLAETV